MTLDQLNGNALIGDVWQQGLGPSFDSVNPSNESVLWQGHMSSTEQVEAAFVAAKAAFPAWSRTPLDARLACVQRFKALALESRAFMAELIARETGKLIWDANGEAGALASKVDISAEAYANRTGNEQRDVAFGRAELQHRAHGVMAVLGPYNFPAHLPNGQIIPALLAGNTIVFKPSELTPAVGEALIRLYQAAGFPDGVINLVQGGRDVGAAILDNPHLDGLLFTGSANTGTFIHKHFGGRPDIILALEMGGNNPLIIWEAGDAQAAASLAVQSAFASSGQRCTCARRLILPTGAVGDAVLSEILTQTKALNVGAWDDDSANIGPLVSGATAGQVISQAERLLALGATPLLAAQLSAKGDAFVQPAIYDVTGCDVPDAEIFGPVLQVIRVDDWDAAITAANDTRFGLAAGLISDNHELWSEFRRDIRAGVVNFNRPTTGAASFLPFGGPGFSGNHNPGAYYAADFCAWPMSSQIADAPQYLPLQGPTKS